jgi:hypothetical protein
MSFKDSDTMVQLIPFARKTDITPTSSHSSLAQYTGTTSVADEQHAHKKRSGHLKYRLARKVRDNINRMRGLDRSAGSSNSSNRTLQAPVMTNSDFKFENESQASDLFSSGPKNFGGFGLANLVSKGDNGKQKDGPTMAP